MDLRCMHSNELRIAITGSTGFVGKSLLTTFNAVDFESKSFTDIDESSTVIHLAADVSPTREGFLTNMALDSFLLEKVNEKHKGLIYASSNNVYPYALNCRIGELQKLNDYYAVSKVFGEKLIADWCAVPAVIVRIADVFGAKQRHGNFFKAIESSIRSNTPLNLYGKGLKRRTYIHVTELCESLKYLALNKLNADQSSEVLNLGYSDSASIAEIVHEVSKITELPIIYTDVNDDSSEFDIRTMTVSNLTGYKPHWKTFRGALYDYVNEILK